ncbi:MAG TPA: hypothetical protein VGE22_03600 [Solimonas sp.]
MTGAVGMGVILSGCASSLNSMQKSELRGYEAKGLAVEEKAPGAGAALGILPGGGSFYVREYGYGIVNLLFWPLSILWDPVSGYQGSMALNYHATRASVSKAMNKELQVLEDQLALKQIDTEQYIMRKREIERRYSPDA